MAGFSGLLVSSLVAGTTFAHPASLDGGLREAIVQQALDGLADLLRNPPKGVELPDELLDYKKKVADALDDIDPADIKDLDSAAAAGVPVFWPGNRQV